MIFRKPQRTPPVEGLVLTIDTGGNPARAKLFRQLQDMGIVALLLAIASIPLSEGYAAWSTNRALRKEWIAAGRACPVVAALSPAVRGAKPPKPFVYKGVGFAFQIGDVACAPVPEKSLFTKITFPVCQFDAPGGIAVTAGGRTTYFEPGIGHGATVAVHAGQPPSCVMLAGVHD
ncbi:MAG: hypothetical protein ACXWKO_19675 [Phenylobacterium sp.]